MAYRHDSVCGFDIAGAEDGYPPSRFAEAFDYLKRNNFEFTIHAGEAFGLPSIWEAVQVARPGWATASGWSATSPWTGRWASWPRDIWTAGSRWSSARPRTCRPICSRIADHPFGVLAVLQFRVTVSCDNRLMSRTTLSREFALLAEAFGYDLADLHRFSVNAAKSAFLLFDQEAGVDRADQRGLRRRRLRPPAGPDP